MAYRVLHAMDTIMRPRHPDAGTPDCQNLLVSLEKAHVTAIGIRGSAIFNYLASDHFIPRSAEDLDLSVFADREFSGEDKGPARIAIEQLARLAAQTCKMNILTLNEWQMSLEDIAKRRLLKKGRIYLTFEVTPPHLAEMISHPEAFGLNGRDVEILKQVDAKVPFTVYQKLETTYHTPHPDMPPVTVDGQSVDTQQRVLRGVLINNPLLEIVGKVQAYNNTTRKKLLADAVDLHNLLTLFDGSVLNDHHFDMLEKHVYRAGTNNHQRLLMKAVTTGELSSLLADRDKLTAREPQPDMVNGLLEKSEAMYMSNRIGAQLTRDEISKLMDDAFTLSVFMLGERNAIYNKLPEKKEPTPTWVGRIAASVRLGALQR